MIQGTEEWFEARLGKATASRFSDVMARTRNGYGAGRKNYMMELLCQRLTGAREEGFTSAAMQRGTELEPLARSAYEVATGNIVEECGFLEHEFLGAGASPDGLVGEDGIIEIKCPNTAQHVECIRTGQPDPKYKWQIQGQLWIAGRAWCDFVSFDDRLPEELQVFRVRVAADAEQIKELDSEVGKFLDELDQLEHEMRDKMREPKEAA